MIDRFEGERWRQIPGVDLGYEVSSFGRVRSWLKRGPNDGNLASRPHLLTPRQTSPADRMDVGVRKNGAYKMIGVARAVLSAFVGPPPSSNHFALHDNDKREDNRLENLRWGTPLENAADARKNGGKPPFEDHVCPHCGGAVSVVRVNSPEGYYQLRTSQ